MGKIRANIEKRLKNEAYAEKYRKERPDEPTDEERKLKRQGGLYGKWCRTHGHPPECDCAYK